MAKSHLHSPVSAKTYLFTIGVFLAVAGLFIGSVVSHMRSTQAVILGVSSSQDR